MVKVSTKKTNSKFISYIVIAVVLFVFIFKTDIFRIMGDGSSGLTNIEINIKDKDESLASIQGKWSITLIGYFDDEDINLRWDIDGNDVRLYSKTESQRIWNMDSPDEVSRLRLMSPLSDYAYYQVYHRLVSFNDVKEKNDILGQTSLTQKLGSMKIYADRIEMFSMNGLTDFSRGWD